ncbi:unnamed protein product [Trichobilharzia regenti]|nr:unnamed protein product [Trichobilharzia regenti]
MDSVSMNALMTSPYLETSSPRQHEIRLSPQKRTNYNLNNKNSNSATTTNNNKKNGPLRHKLLPPSSSSVSDKHDSTSSGRGYSLTGTQTVPCQSSNIASIRSSLLELHTYPDSPNTCAVVIDSPNHHSRKDNIMNESNSTSCGSSCDSIGTSSILAWDDDRDEDHERRRPRHHHHHHHSKKRKGDKRHQQQRQLDGSLDELTSILSASLSMDDDDGANAADDKIPATSRLSSDGRNGGWPPTTSELIKETNVFAHALEKRLEYLK